jgi:isocitrate/isopropylmalate dehydrogenase
MTRYRIAEIGGDGIGPDVVAEAVRVLEAAAGDGLHFSFERSEVGAALYRRTGEELPRDRVDLCRSADAILSAAMMCRRLGAQDKDPLATAAGDRIEAAVTKALQDPRARTRDIGGEASTRAAGDAVIKAL